MYIKQAPWPYLLATVLLLSYTFKIEVDPFTPLWGSLAPGRYAAWRLTAAYMTPPIEPEGCFSYLADRWRRVAADSLASQLFQQLFLEATAPAGRILALAGLQSVDTATYQRLRPTRLSGPGTLIPVESADTITPIPIETVLDSLDSGALRASLWGSATWPEC